MEYRAPRSFQEALDVLSRFAGQASVIAGGTDLVVDIKFRGWEPQCLVNINRAQDISYVRQEEDGLHIGSLTTMRALEIHSVMKKKYSALAEAAHNLGSTQIRNRATVGGNVCRASPAADTTPALMALGARAVLASAKGERCFDLQHFFLGPRRTVLAADELLREFRIETLPPGSGSSYQRLGFRGALDLAIVSVASFMTLDSSDGAIRNVRLALGSVAPTVIRAPKTEALLKGQQLTAELLAEAGTTAAGECRPITDLRSTAEYRKAMVAVLTRRSLQLSFQRARESQGGTES